MESMFELFPSIASNVDVYCEPKFLKETEVSSSGNTKKATIFNPFAKEPNYKCTKNQEVIITDSSEPKLVYRCHYPNCDKTFARLSYLLQHEYTHTGVMPYKCRKCNEQFFLKCDFKKHKQIHKLNARKAKHNEKK